MSIESLFCPPEGAMQFAFTSWKHQPFVWVTGPDKRGCYRSPCDCMVVWHVVKSALTKSFTEANKNELRSDMCVCECLGRIIE
jgi:hypothetical protein